MDVIHAVDSEWPDQILCTNEEHEMIIKIAMMNNIAKIPCSAGIYDF